MTYAAFSETPYGELVDTSLRVMTWNVWGRFGPWERRSAGIIAHLCEAKPDVVLLQECWITEDGSNQAGLIGAELGLESVVAQGELLFGAWGLTNAVLSRWPISDPMTHLLPSLTPDGWAVLRCVARSQDRDDHSSCTTLRSTGLRTPARHANTRCGTS